MKKFIALTIVVFTVCAGASELSRIIIALIQLYECGISIFGCSSVSKTAVLLVYTTYYSQFIFYIVGAIIIFRFSNKWKINKAIVFPIITLLAITPFVIYPIRGYVERISYEYNKQKESQELQKGDCKNPNGPNIKTYEDGGKFEFTCVNSKYDGFTTKYTPTGKISDQLEYKNGKIEGLEIYFDQDESVSMIVRNRNNSYPNGKQIFNKAYEGQDSFQVYYKDKCYNLIGPQVIYDDYTKKIKEEFSCESGLLSGKYKAYMSDGKLEKEMTFINGLLEGEYKRYYYNGKIEFEQYLTNNKNDGLATWYNQDGTIRGQFEFDNGKLVKILQEEAN